MSCWQLTARAGIAVALYAAGMLSSTYVLALLLPSALAAFYGIVTALFLSILALFLSLLLAFFTRSVLAAISSLLSVPVAMTLAGARVLPEHLLALLGSSVGAVALILLFSRRIGESSLDFARGPSSWSPTALAAAAPSLWLVTSLFEFPCEVLFLLIASSLLSAVVSSLISRNVAESLLLGALSGLGPVGLTVSAIIASFRPLPPLRCEGLDIGELLGYTHFSSVNRSMTRRGGEDWRQEVIACSQRGRAVLALQEPWILWIYGRDSEAVAERLTRRLGGFRKLGGEGSGTRALRFAEILAEISSLGGQDMWLDLRFSGLREEEVEVIAFEAVRRARRVIVSLPEMPWRDGSLSPKGPARSAGAVFAGLEDLGQAERVSQALSPSSEGLRESVMRGYPLFAFPGCEGKLIAFKQDDLKAVQV